MYSAAIPDFGAGAMENWVSFFNSPWSTTTLLFFI
jgi:aminopeptidase N